MEELEKLFHSLANKNRLEILRTLANANPEYMTWSELKNALKATPNALSYNLGVLLNAGLIEHKLKKSEKGYSCYRITDLGKRYLEEELE